MSKALLFVEFQGLGHGWATLNELLSQQPQNTTITLEACYPTAQSTCSAFITGPLADLQKALDRLKAYKPKSLQIYQNAAALLEATHGLRTPENLKNIIIVESEDPALLLGAADALPTEDVFEIHLRRAGQRGGWVFAKDSTESQARLNQLQPQPKWHVITDLNPQISQFF